MPLLLEYWKPVVGFESFYLVSNTGRVISIRRNVEHRQTKNPWGYPRVRFKFDGVEKKHFVHKLVAATFVGLRPEGMQINHIDGCKQNNRVSNLEYVTRKENFAHAARLGLMDRFFEAKRLPRPSRCLRG